MQSTIVQLNRLVGCDVCSEKDTGNDKFRSFRWSITFKGIYN